MPVAATYTLKIADQTVNAVAGTLDLQNQIGQRSTGSVTVWTALGVTWSYGTQIKVYDETGALSYAGYVTKDKAYRDEGAYQGKGYLLHDLQLVDNCYKADKRTIFYTTLNRAAGGIVRDLLALALTAEGVTTLPGSIATGPTITEVIWNGKRVSAALDYLATQCGYWWNIDKNDVLWFQPYGGVPAPWVLDGSQVSSDANLSVTNGNEMYVNRQYVRGATAETGIQTETFYGDGHRRNWTLSYEIASTGAKDLSIAVDGTYQTIGTKGATGEQFYAAIGDAVIAQDPGQPMLGSGDSITVTYKGRYPVLAMAANNKLIAAQRAREGGGTGYVESVYSDTKVHSQGAAFQIAGGLLAHYGQDMTVLEFDTLTSGLQDGQMLTCNLPDFGLSHRQMLISGVAVSDQKDGINIWFHVKAVGSPYDVANWQTFFQNVMNQQADPSDLSDTSDGSALALIIASAAGLSLHAAGSMTHTVCVILPATIPFTLC